jgi:hypothetical protein
MKYTASAGIKNKGDKRMSFTINRFLYSKRARQVKIRNTLNKIQELLTME